MGKLNVYITVQCIRRKELFRGLVTSLNIEIFVMNLIITVVLGLLFIPNYIYYCLYGSPVIVMKKTMTRSDVSVFSTTSNPVVQGGGSAGDSISRYVPPKRDENNDPDARSTRVISKSIDDEGIRLSVL